MSSTADSWIITSMKKCPTTAKNTQLLGSTNFSLDTVLAYDIEVETTFANKRKGRKMTLLGVPMFLVEAFTWLENHNGFTVEGIFRKDGNATRIRNPWQIFCGLSRIPDNFTVHDVCSLIKRFFSSLRKPILAEQQSQIIGYVATITNEKVQVEALLSLIDQLPTSNQATLCFLMRQLKRISEHSELNRMTVDNLAIVFVPAIFNETKETRSSSSIWASNSDGSRLVARSLHSIGNCRKKKADSQESLREMESVKQQENLQASVISLMIRYSHHICVPRMIPLSRGFLHRKSSDVQSPMQVQVIQPTGLAETRRGRTPNRSRADKIWPRSASENPFARTRTLFSLPFGKNGSFVPNENAIHNTPKVQQSRPVISCQSPANNKNINDDVSSKIAIQFISPSASQQISAADLHQQQRQHLSTQDKQKSPHSNRKTSTESSSASTSSKIFQRLFS